MSIKGSGIAESELIAIGRQCAGVELSWSVKGLKDVCFLMSSCCKCDVEGEKCYWVRVRSDR